MNDEGKLPPDAPRLRVEGLHKLYRRMAPGAHLRTLKSALLEGSLTRGLEAKDVIPALAGISFEVPCGQAFGVVGGNGCGKSTLLKVLSGILQPTQGEVVVHGRVAALIELGAGFHPEISGRENVYINGALLGLSREEIDQRYDAIVAFSGLADFMEEPVKNYSSGMYVRLGFAVAIHTHPEVLLVDEVLSVGDESFAHRCIRRIEEFLAGGGTLLFVSHDLDMVERLCDRVLWLDKGKARMIGSPRRVIDGYRQAVAEAEAEEMARDAQTAQGTRAAESEPGAGPNAASDSGAVESNAQVLRWGSGEAEILGLRILDGEGREHYHLHSGQPVTFEISARAETHQEDFVFGIGISTPRGTECWGTNTDLAGIAPRSFSGEGTVTLHCPALRLAPGEYLIDVAVHARDGAPYDYRKRFQSFTVTAADRGVGIYFPEHRWSAGGGIEWDLVNRQADPAV